MIDPEGPKNYILNCLEIYYQDRVKKDPNWLGVSPTGWMVSRVSQDPKGKFTVSYKNEETESTVTGGGNTLNEAATLARKIISENYPVNIPPASAFLR